MITASVNNNFHQIAWDDESFEITRLNPTNPNVTVRFEACTYTWWRTIKYSVYFMGNKKKKTDNDLLCTNSLLNQQEDISNKVYFG